MGNPVTLDSDDVECLLTASALARETEARFRAMEDDPQFLRLNGKIDDAFRRINRIRGDAIRIEEPFDPAQLTDRDLEILKACSNEKLALGEFNMSYNEIIAPELSAPVYQSDIQTLRRFKLVVLGELIEYSILKWGDKTEDKNVSSVGQQFIKATARGLKLLEERKSNAPQQL